jgi:hypothetical protein
MKKVLEFKCRIYKQMMPLVMHAAGYIAQFDS